MKSPQNKIVSVIIVSSGIKEYLKSCLDSLKGQTYFNLDIIIIDNSLNPDFGQEMSKGYPQVKLYSSSKNLFYCAALNLGIDTSRGEFILCLNNDVILDKRFIEEALKGFEIDARVGMVSGKILRTDGKTIDSTGLFLSIWRTAKERGYNSKDMGQFEKEGYVFGVNGAVAFYRKEMLEAVKVDSDYFDRDYRFFYEDLDISWRAQNIGWKAYYLPKAVAYHVRGGTARRGCGINKPYARRYLSDDLHLDLLKNRYLTLIKNETVFGFLLHLPFIALYDIVMWSYVSFFRPLLIKKFLLSLNYFSSAFRKRKLIRKLRFSVGKHRAGRFT